LGIEALSNVQQPRGNPAYDLFLSLGVYLQHWHFAQMRRFRPASGRSVMVALQRRCSELLALWIRGIRLTERTE